MSKIEWTDKVWNAVTGCDKVSPGCKNCYAKSFSSRLMHIPKYSNVFELTMHEELLCLPSKWKKPQKIFVNSMSDLFHPKVTDDFIYKTFQVMNAEKRHTFQILTKRAERLLKMNKDLQWGDNIWMGVTVENNDYVHRIELLKQTDAHIKFISFEPLLGPIKDLHLEGINQIILGGETGNRARQMEKEWVLPIRDYCIEMNIPFFFKKMGGKGEDKKENQLDGKIYHEFPDIK